MNPQRGASKLEFALVVAILGILAAVLVARLDAIQAEAERTAVDLTLRNIRIGIQLAIGERIMHGQEARIIEVAEANPFDFLGQRPRDFNDGRVPRASGEWAYDQKRRELAYRPRLPGAFGGATELRWSYVRRVDSAGRTVGVSLVGQN